jgi:hypothetical protein
MALRHSFFLDSTVGSTESHFFSGKKIPNIQIDFSYSFYLIIIFIGINVNKKSIVV